MKSTTTFRWLAVVLLMLGSAAISHSQIWIEWSPNSEPDLSHYCIYRTSSPNASRPGFSEAFLTRVQSCRYVDFSAPVGSTYYYWVSAVDQCGNESSLCGPLKAEAFCGRQDSVGNQNVSVFSVRHLDEDQDPQDPYIDASTDNDQTLDFSWDPIPQEGSRYRIYLSKNQEPDVFITEIQESSYQIVNAVPGCAYRLSVDVIGSDQQLLKHGISMDVLCDVQSDVVPVPGRPEAVELK